MPKPRLAPGFDTKRKKRSATNDLLTKDFNRKINKSIYGKTMQIVKKRLIVKYKFGSAGSQTVKWHSKINFPGAKLYQNSSGGFPF